MNLRDQALAMRVKPVSLESRAFQDELLKMLEDSIERVGELTTFQRKLYEDVIDDMAQECVVFREGLDAVLVKLRQAYQDIPAADAGGDN